MKIGYARVSTDDQNPALQMDALKRAGCEKVFRDDGLSGAIRNRPALLRCLKKLQRGDTLIVWKLVSVVLGLQAELARFGSDHGRAGNRPGTYDDPAVGSSLHPGVPKALEPLRTYGRRVLANGRDLDQGAWPVEVLPSRGEEENVQAMR